MKSLLLTILEWIGENLERLNAIGSNEYITSGISAFPDAYSACSSIANTVCQPIAYTLLTIFLLLDLYGVTMHLTQQGGGGMAAPTAVLKSVIKFAMVKWLIDNSTSILSAVFSIAISITTSINTSSGTSAASLIPQMQQIIEDSNAGITEGLGSVLIMFVTYLATWVAIIGTTYVILSRFVQVYFFLALAPIPLSFFGEQHAMQVGMSFFRGFSSVCLQSAVIALALRLYPMFASALTTNGDSISSYCLQIAMLTIILVGTVFGSSQIAKAVFGTG